MPLARPPIVVIAPDSFKGSLHAAAVCASIARGLARVVEGIEVRSCPMADGGEGTLDAVLSRGGERRDLHVSGAAGGQRAAAYGIVDAAAGRTAVIEIAEIVGITDPDGTAVPVTRRATQGVGEMIRALLDTGIRRFMIGLGGSSTNDGGAGMLAALGLGLNDAAGRDVEPTPAGLASLARVDARGLDPRLVQSSITIMSDVNNPLCGARGATAIFGPQKGVPANDIGSIDAVLERYAALAERAVPRRAANDPGAGAAGGLGFALQLVGGAFRSGAEVVADLIGLDAAMKGADWAFTGEGRTDAQTLLRKAPFVVAERARAAGVPITLLSGAVDAAALPELGRVFAGCFSLTPGPMTLAECIANADALLADRAEQIARVAARAWEQGPR
ncbi:MAG: glycerate kinase [Betaproteobacteria bacterium]